MIETIKGICRAEGFLMALASMAADRELCGDKRDSFIMKEAKLLASKINIGSVYIVGAEKEIKELREEIECLRGINKEIPGR